MPRQAADLSFWRKESADSLTDTLASTTISDDGVNNIRGPLGLNLLYSPAEPLIDFIFVHGLGGGSRKTWSKTNSVTHYWPQEWLPKDPAFKDVRVHSFGYDSDWVKGKENCLNIEHFGRSLLGELCTSPHLGDSQTKIVLLGHSMGGLVIKKAYILARQGIGYEKLAARIHTMCFLGTPHQGSGSARFLNNLLQITNNSRAYVADLEIGSKTLKSINDDFRDYCASIAIWSFYETQKLKVGPVSTLIVDPNSAILGYRAEKQIPMNADHRSICKFETVSDANYIILRNAFVTVVRDIIQQRNDFRKILQDEHIRNLNDFLGESGEPEDDLANVEESRLPGTCTWLCKRESYQRWDGLASQAPRVLWICGKPAAGKSVLAGYVIRQLKQENKSCSYFFFKHGDKSKSKLSRCLRALAFQMASMNATVANKLREVQEGTRSMGNDSDRTIWRKLFVSGIFETSLPRQYWVIDALDECNDAASVFGPMLTHLDGSIPLRILITSREMPELERQFLSCNHTVFQRESITIADTLPDIKLLVEAKAKLAPIDNAEARAALVERILSKSEGTFLWTALVLDTLSISHSTDEIDQALDNLPGHMTPLYQRILNVMENAQGGKKLAQAVLTWTTCTTRPVTIQELSGALLLDVEERYPKLAESIKTVCGQLVNVDAFSRVHLVHGTARDFLLDKGLKSEFAIKRPEAHTRIARACLKYLTNDEMRPPRSIKRGFPPQPGRQRADFSDYACTAFSYHLAHADPFAHDLLALVDKFLRSNVLSWIEVVASTQSLVPLVRAAKDLRKYHNSCAAAISPLSSTMQRIRDWMTDFVRIVAKFADALTVSPLAIHALVPPFCPRDSSIGHLTGSGRKLQVLGFANSCWDDRISCVDFRESFTSAVAYGDDYFAVGLLNGTIVTYHTISYQEFKTFTHGEPVRTLQFQDKTAIMASCGTKTMKIWDVQNGALIHDFQIPQRVLGLTFDKNLLTVALHNNCLVTWDLDDGSLQPVRCWSDSEEDTSRRWRRTPCAFSMSTSHRMLAVAYNGRPIILWDMEDNTYYGECGKKLASGETSTHMVSALVLNPNADIELLAASYLDGDLALLDPFNDEQIQCSRANCHTLTASPDGRLLAGGAGGGIIQIYEFDTLRMLYRVKASNIYIKQLAFSKDSLQLCDIRGSHFNLWEPTILLRDSVQGDSSEGTLTSNVEVVTSDTKSRISALCMHPEEDLIFCGKDDGVISFYELKTGSEIRVLYQHKAAVRIITWWQRTSTIMSVDASNSIIAWRLKSPSRGKWTTDTALFQSRLENEKSIVQLLPGEAADKFILSTRHSDHLWTIDSREEEARILPGKPGARQWLQHQQSELHVVCMEGLSASIYTWENWSSVKSIQLAFDVKGLQFKSTYLVVSGSQQGYLLELSEINGSPRTCALHLLDAAPFKIDDPSVVIVNVDEANRGDNEGKPTVADMVAGAHNVSTLLRAPQLTSLAQRMAHVLGFRKPNQLIFLDSRSWVCSVDLNNTTGPSVSYSRHFFVPYDWFAGSRDLLGAVTQRDVMFAKDDELVVVKGGSHFAQEVVLELGSAPRYD